MILDIFKYSLEYVIKDKIAFLKLSLLSLLSFLIIPFIMIQGYCYRIINIQLNSFINANDPLPEYNNFKDLIIDGLKIIIVNFIYSIPFLIVFTLTISEIIGISGQMISIEITENILLVIILFIIGFFTFVISQVAITQMVYRNSFKSAFKISDIIQVIKEIKLSNYLKFFIGYILLIFAILLCILLVIESIVSTFHFNYIPMNLGFITIGLDVLIILLIYILIVYPLFAIFEARSIAALYNMRESE